MTVESGALMRLWTEYIRPRWETILVYIERRRDPEGWRKRNPHHHSLDTGTFQEAIDDMGRSPEERHAIVCARVTSEHVRQSAVNAGKLIIPNVPHWKW